MNHQSIIALAVLCSLPALAAGQEASCPQIREQISAQTGLVDKPNIDLLRKISGRGECNFTAAEVYRAAYGDTPLPPSAPQRRSPREHGEEDDD
ncbi:MAG: hypothetical protein H6R15_261 [Proteobacteria bacterium]|nr:hypothetical protein [Pseudomonadota bacterium]